MAEVTVKQFADVVGVSTDRLLAQLEEAGLSDKQSEDLISDEEKTQLLTYLRRMHGKEETGTEPTKVTLKRKTVSELRVPTERSRARSRPKAGPSKTVSVEFRKKRTYVKRSVVAEEEASRIEKEAAEQDRIKAEEEAVLRAEEEAREALQREKQAAEEAEQAARRAAEEAEAKARAEAEAAVKNAEAAREGVDARSRAAAGLLHRRMRSTALSGRPRR